MIYFYIKDIFFINIMVVKIKDREFKVKHTLMGDIICEREGIKLGAEGIENTLKTIWAHLLGANKLDTKDLPFEEFVYMIEDDYTVLMKLNDAFIESFSVANSLIDEDQKSEEDDLKKN